MPTRPNGRLGSQSVASAAAVLAVGIALPGVAAVDDVLLIEEYETAGLDGRAWDRSNPGATTVDAVHRSVLIRFPDAAAEIPARLEGGESIERVELVLASAATPAHAVGVSAMNMQPHTKHGTHA